MATRVSTLGTRIVAAVAVLLLLPIAGVETSESGVSLNINEACADGGCCFDPGSICTFAPQGLEAHRYFAGGGC